MRALQMEKGKLSQAPRGRSGKRIRRRTPGMAKHPARAAERPGGRARTAQDAATRHHLPFHPSPFLLPSPLPRGVSPGLGSVEGGK